jgi:transposase
MEDQLRQSPVAGPEVIGIDEIALRKGHRYRIVVSDLERGRAIWYGEKDRSEESMDRFYEWLGSKKAKKIRLSKIQVCPFAGTASQMIIFVFE